MNRAITYAMAVASMMALASARPLAQSASCATDTTRGDWVVAFGRAGGNIRPYRVTVRANGAIASDDSAQAKVRAAPADAHAVASLLRLARQENFWSMRTRPTALPRNKDLAARFLEIRERAAKHCREHRVEWYGKPSSARLRTLYQRALDLAVAP